MYFRSGSTHPGFTEFFRIVFLQFKGWMMDVGIWRTSYSYPVSLVREVPGRWNDGYQSLCLLMTTTGFSQQTQSDFRMVGYDRFFCFM